MTKASFPVVVTDSRGYTNTSYSASASGGIVSYVPLTINANFYRPQPTTGEVSLTYSGNYFNGSFGSVSNTLSISWKYRTKGASSWTNGGTITPTLSGNTITSKTISLGTSFDYQTAYEFQILASDKLTTLTQTYQVSMGMPVFHWGKDYMSINQKLILRDSPANMGACRDVTVASSYVRLFTYNMSAQWKNTSIWFTLCDTQSTNESLLCHLYARRGSNTEGASITQLKCISIQSGFDFNRLVAVVTSTNTIEVYFKMNSNDSPAISITSMTKMFPEDSYGKIILDCSTTVSSLPSGTSKKSSGIILGRKSLSSRSHTGWGTTNDYLVDTSMLSYWNGAYDSGNASNLLYCVKGPIRGSSNAQIYWGRQTVSCTAWTPRSFGNVTNSTASGRFSISGNNIIVGSGVTRVKVSVNSVSFHPGSGGDRVTYINVGGTNYDVNYTSAGSSWGAGGSGSRIVNVSSGTTITMQMTSGITQSIEHLGAILVVEDLT